MKTGSILILAILYTIALAVLLWIVYGRLHRPRVVTVPEVRYVDRVIERRDTVIVDRPVYRRIYLQQTDTVYVRVPVPVGFRAAGVISPTPIRIDGRTVTLTYWAPDSLRFIQDDYIVRRPRWGFKADAGGGKTPVGLSVDARLDVRYKALTAYVGYALQAHNGFIYDGPVYGVRLKLIGSD